MIRRVTSRSQVDGVIFPHANPVYALELKPYVDEPPLIATHLNSGSLDLCTDRDVVHDIVRHKFILSNRDAIEEYWEVLEYAYAMADPKAALHAFPGCTVHKVCMQFYFCTYALRCFRNFHMGNCPCRLHL